MSIPLCIYSHSSYFDILRIQLDYFKKLFTNKQQDVYLFVDKPYTLASGGSRLGKYKQSKRKRNSKKTRKNRVQKQYGGQQDTSVFTYKTILYDENKQYMGRLAQCIKQVPSSYLILIHERDILIRYEQPVIEKIVEVMKQNGIDSVDLNDHRDGKELIPVTETISLSLKGVDDIYHFSVQPRLLAKDSALKLYIEFSGNSYRASEDLAIQEYMKKNQKSCGLVDTSSVKSTRDFTTSPSFSYIHLTSNSKLIAPNKKNNLEPFIQEEHEKIFEKYFKNTKRYIDN